VVRSGARPESEEVKTSDLYIDVQGHAFCYGKGFRTLAPPRGGRLVRGLSQSPVTRRIRVRPSFETVTV